VDWEEIEDYIVDDLTFLKGGRKVFMVIVQNLCHQLGICDPAIADEAISDRVRMACPVGTYSSIVVCTTAHRFLTGRQIEPSRLITFQPTYREAAKNLLSIIFQRTTQEILLLVGTLQGLLGSQDPEDRHYAASAYWQNHTIKGYISMGEAEAFNWDIETEQGAVTFRVFALGI
jgi:hypothetical protein